MLIRTTLLAFLVCVLSLPTTSNAAGPTPAFLWLNQLHAKPGESEALTRLLVIDGTHRFSPLIELGLVLEWGVAIPLLADGAESLTHVEWVTLAGWTASDEVARAHAERRSSTQWAQLVDSRIGITAITRSVTAGRGTPVQPGYVHMSYLIARSPQAARAVYARARRCASVFDDLVRQGDLANYGLLARELATPDSWSHISWYATNRLADRARVPPAGDCPGEGQSAGGEWETGESHADIPRRDQILRIVHYRRFQGKDSLPER